MQFLAKELAKNGKKVEIASKPFMENGTIQNGEKQEHNKYKQLNFKIDYLWGLEIRTHFRLYTWF